MRSGASHFTQTPRQFPCGRRINPNPTVPIPMKKLLLLTLLSCAFAAQTMPAFADATGAQKAQFDRTAKEVQTALSTDEGCKVMCETMMGSPKAKAMMCDMIKKDPECMKMMKH